MNELAPKPAVEAQTQAEARVFAREMFQAHQEMVAFYAKHEGLDRSEVLKTELEGHAKDWPEQIKNADPIYLSYWSLHRLSQAGQPEAAAGLWQNAKQAAIDDFETGSRALHVIDLHPDPNDAARFQALRNSFREEWQPRGGTELLLIDQLAQVQTMYELWLQRHMLRMSSESYRDWKAQELANSRGEWITPRQSEAEATRESFEMAEKFQRMFLRTLRALRDLRRYVPPVVIQNAGQVNVGNQQLNVAASPAG